MKIVEVIDRTLGMVAGAIGGTVVGMAYGISIIIEMGEEDSTMLVLPVAAFLMFWSSGFLIISGPVLFLVGAGVSVGVCYMFAVAVGGIGGLFYGMYKGFNDGLSGLITGTNQWQERSTPSLSGSSQQDGFDSSVRANGETVFCKPSQLEENYIALIERVRALRVPNEAKQYIQAMITEEELAEFKGIIDATPDAEKEHDQELYERLIAKCQITHNSLLRKTDPPITVRREMAGERVFFSTYKYSAFLNYLMTNKDQEHIDDPFLHVPLNSKEITFFIGFPHVSKEDFDYIREQLRKKVASPRSAASERVSSASQALFYHSTLGEEPVVARQPQLFTDPLRCYTPE